MAKEFYVTPKGALWKVNLDGTTLAERTTRADAVSAAMDLARDESGAKVLARNAAAAFDLEWQSKAWTSAPAKQRNQAPSKKTKSTTKAKPRSQTKKRTARKR